MMSTRFNRMLIAFNWLFHNVIGHPIAGILWFIHLPKAGEWVHNITLPPGEKMEDLVFNIEYGRGGQHVLAQGITFQEYEEYREAGGVREFKPLREFEDEDLHFLDQVFG
jgi:hypothetical protein